MKLNGFDIGKAQLGWRSECFFRVETAGQFTDEYHSAVGGSRWFVLALIKSYLAARRCAAILKAKPGERAAKGWT